MAGHGLRGWRMLARNSPLRVRNARENHLGNAGEKLPALGKRFTGGAFRSTPPMR